MTPGFDFFFILLLTWPALGRGSQIHFTFLSVHPERVHHFPGLRENLASPFLEQRWSGGQ